MEQRKYSIQEIDEMRKALRIILIPLKVSYSPEEKVKEIEEHLRTYMLNGTDPSELNEKMQQKLDSRDSLFDSVRRRPDPI